MVFCCTIDLFMKALVVGSSIVDVLLYLDDPSKITLTDTDLIFKLGDKIPLSHTVFETGGNGANVAVALQNFGIPTSFYTYLSTDALSSYLKSKITERGVTLISPDSNTEKSPVSLILNLPQDRVILSYHPESNHEFSPNIQEVSFDAIYVTSISNTWETAYEQILEFAEKNSTKIAFSPGSKQMENMNEIFRKVLHASTYLFINLDEAKRILETFDHRAESIHDILNMLLTLGPSLVSVTDGKNGAYSLSRDSEALFLPPFGEGGGEKTGAGDSYAAAFLSAILQGEDIKTAMRWGALNAHFVMQIPGAQNGLLNTDEIRTLCDENDSFQPKNLE